MVGAVSIAIAIVLGPTFNVAFLVGLAFAVAASANLPVILLSIFWKRFTTQGAVCGPGHRPAQFAGPDRDQPEHHGPRRGTI